MLLSARHPESESLDALLTDDSLAGSALVATLGSCEIHTVAMEIHLRWM
jgi:hypothetical protein